MADVVNTLLPMGRNFGEKPLLNVDLAVHAGITLCLVITENSPTLLYIFTQLAFT